jgi:hypothetical protein
MRQPVFEVRCRHWGAKTAAQGGLGKTSPFRAEIPSGLDRALARG